MTYFFSTSKHILLPTIKKHTFISTSEQYNHAIVDMIRSVRGIVLQKSSSSRFSKEIRQIQASAPLSEKTIWGGVTLKKVDVEQNFIQKLLVIKKYGVLGFEIHKKKLEKLKILEGTCIVLYSNHGKKQHSKGEITVKIASPSDRFIFHPKDEHGIIALTNCLIEETSTNHLDDVVYIFKAEQLDSYDTRSRNTQKYPK